MSLGRFHVAPATDRIRLVKSHLDFLDYHSWKVKFVWVSSAGPSPAFGAPSLFVQPLFLRAR